MPFPVEFRSKKNALRTDRHSYIDAWMHLKTVRALFRYIFRNDFFQPTAGLGVLGTELRTVQDGWTKSRETFHLIHSSFDLLGGSSWK